MLVFSIAQIPTGYTMGKILDKCGNKVGIIILLIAGILSYSLLLSVVIMEEFNALLFICAIFSGWFEMTGRVCCTTILGG